MRHSCKRRIQMVDLIKVKRALWAAPPLASLLSGAGSFDVVSRLILASASPRRSQLLHGIGLDFEVIPSNVVEEEVNGADPADLVMRLAYAKAADVAGGIDHGLVIGADTIVVADGHVLGKPVDRDDAIRMLHKLSGKEHQVYSGVSVIDAGSGNSATEYEMTNVKFRTVSDEKIARYVDTGEPMGKAGAYAIQGIGGLLVESIRGDYNCVVGLPLGRLALMLESFGYIVF